MAKPRIFVSSTFYDLRQIREDLDRFISELGYESVLHEAGDIAYGKDSPPEGYLSREIQMCDILICVIGGRYGSESQEEPGTSITQRELLTAVKNQIQVFIFIEQSVYSEYGTYSLNKEISDINYNSWMIFASMSLLTQSSNYRGIIPLRHFKPHLRLLNT